MTYSKQIEQAIEKARHMSPAELELLSVPQTRVVAGITLGAVYEDFVSSKLYRECAPFFTEEKWLYEALTPLPFISISVGEKTRGKIEELVDWACSSQGEMRVVVAKGCVEHGAQGNIDGYFRQGSSGLLISSVIQGCILLPREGSWANQSVMEFMKFECSESAQIDKETFYLLPNQEVKTNIFT